jgi:16S rRNA (uracil1498-N3)-methyltransferase
MHIDAVRSWSEFINGDFSGYRVLIADPSGKPVDAAIASLDRQPPVVAAIGPEGGFTRQEIDTALAAGGRLVSLGENILRVETAALALCVLLLLSTADG